MVPFLIISWSVWGSIPARPLERLGGGGGGGEGRGLDV